MIQGDWHFRKCQSPHTQMVLLIPYARFTFRTHLQAYEVEHQLREHAEPSKLRRWWSPHNQKYFIGMVANKKFSIYHIRYYRKGLPPIIVGQIYDDLGASRIEVTMCLNSIQIVGTILIFATLFINLFFSSESRIIINNAIFFLGILIFTYVFTMIFFNKEANKARRYLEEIFQVNAANF